MLNKLLTTRQVCEILGISLYTVYTYIVSGKLKAYKLGGDGKSKRHWRIKVKDLENFIAGTESAHAEASKKAVRSSG